jgi:L-lactate dehydrogenase
MKNLIQITIIGSGNVGRTIAKELIDLAIPMHIDIQDPAPAIDAIKQDLRHATSFAKLVTISWNENKLNEADYIFIAAAQQATTIGNRLDKAQGHIDMIYELFKDYQPIKDARIIVITNPVDVITYHTWKASKLPQDRVIGTGTFLETLRFDYYLSELFDVPPTQAKGILLGEHGNSAVVTYSLCNIEGKEKNIEQIKEAAELAINAPYKIRKAGEYTKYAISKCAVGIFKGIHLKEKMAIPAGLILNEKNCSVLNCEPICLSTLVTIEGGEFTQGDLSQLPSDEISALQQGAKILEEHTLSKK